jgi:hypothetical protein
VGEFIRPPRIGPLDTTRNCLIEAGIVYRKMRRGEVPTHVGTRLIYALDVCARMARAVEEVEEIRQLKAKLDLIKAQPSNALAVWSDAATIDLAATAVEAEGGAA